MLWWIILENIILILLPTLPIRSFVFSPLTAKCFNRHPIYFVHTPLHDLVFYVQFDLSILLAPLISQPSLHIFKPNCCYYLFYIISTCLRICKLNWYIRLHYRTHFTQQHKNFYNTKPVLSFFLKLQNHSQN